MNDLSDVPDESKMSETRLCEIANAVKIGPEDMPTLSESVDMATMLLALRSCHTSTVAEREVERISSLQHIEALRAELDAREAECRVKSRALEALSAENKALRELLVTALEWLRETEPYSTDDLDAWAASVGAALKDGAL